MRLHGLIFKATDTRDQSSKTFTVGTSRPGPMRIHDTVDVPQNPKPLNPKPIWRFQDIGLGLSINLTKT